MNCSFARTLLIVSCLSIVGCANTGNTSLEQLTRSAESVLGSSSSGSLSNDDITAGLKEALVKSTNIVVAQLGQQGGFSNDSLIRIPLPDSLKKAQKFATKFGLGKSFDDLEQRLNRAAEQATPKAKSLFVGAVKDMSVNDARGILTGPDNAATSYFQEKTGNSLKTAMRPIVDQSLASVGAVNTFNSLLSSYNAIPGAPKVNADLTSHVVDKGSEGIFRYIAEEEKAIRSNPLKRTSELLQQVFSAQ